jgi:hypothetical protein
MHCDEQDHGSEGRKLPNGKYALQNFENRRYVCAENDEAFTREEERERERGKRERERERE